MTDQVYPPRLRFITYLAPSIPMEYFEMLKEYLEEKLQCYVYLITESRWSGPPDDRNDPFTTGDADIGFACAPSCQRIISIPSSKTTLLGVAPVYINQRSNGKPVYYTDVVVNKDNCKRFKQFEDLRGLTWAYNDDQSGSGHLIIQQELKKMGETASFFGKMIHSGQGGSHGDRVYMYIKSKKGSHLNSIKMILNKTIDGCGIDSVTLALQMKAHPELRDKLHVVTSLGPMPIFPGVVSSQVPEDLKTSIATYLLNMHQEPRWQTRLNEYMVSKFVPVTMDHFQAFRKAEISTSGEQCS